jgi:hypothetical protein
MKERMTTIEVRGPHEASPIRIVADAMIATQKVGDGRMIPLVILDTSLRPDVEELVRLHEHLSPGDAESVWAQLSGHKNSIALILTFVRPAELTIVLEFDVVRQGGMVDRILGAKALYIQAGRDGDRLITTMHHPRIIVDVPHGGFEKEWDNILRKGIVRDFRARGLSRSESKRAAERFIEEWRKLTSFRLARQVSK